MWVESWGWGTFGALLGFTPFRGSHPHLTHASYSAADTEKNGFCLGGIGPHLGRYGGLKIAILAYFGLLLVGTLSTDFRFFDCVRQPHVPSNDAANFRKIKFDNFEQCALEVGNIAVSTEYFALAEALTMAQW